MASHMGNRYSNRYVGVEVQGEVADWYYIASYQLTRPFKPPPKTTVCVPIRVVGRIRSRRNPYTVKRITSRIPFETTGKTEVLIYDCHGRIRERHTYGSDPHPDS